MNENENENEIKHHPLCSRSDRCAGDKCSNEEAARQNLAPRPNGDDDCYWAWRAEQDK